MGSPSYIPPQGRALEESEHHKLLRKMEEIIESSHLFRSLDEEGHRRLIMSGYVTRFNGGDVLMRQGEIGSKMYLVMDGTVRVSVQSESGPVTLAELTSGACVGEVSVLTGTMRTASVEAMTEVNVVAFERHRIHRILGDYPEVREILEAMIVGRAKDTVEKIIAF